MIIWIYKHNRNEARARMKGPYVCCHWLKLLVENSQTAKEMLITIVRILAYNKSYPKIVQGPVSYPLCPVPGYDVAKVQIS